MSRTVTQRPESTRWYSYVLNTLLPARCQLCLSALNASEYNFCHGCLNDLPYLGSCCSICSVPLPHDGLCPECQSYRPAFERCVALLEYRDPVPLLVKAIKSEANSVALYPLAHALGKSLAITYKHDDLPDALVPVPLHWHRLLWRGFNQSHLLGLAMSNITQIPLRDDLCKRVRYKRPQQMMNRKARAAAMYHAFIGSPLTKGMRVALIDDVVTTGATARAASKSLLAAGASRVDVWCLARTPLAQ